jgi:hypothetical protein
VVAKRLQSTSKRFEIDCRAIAYCNQSDVELLRNDCEELRICFKTDSKAIANGSQSDVKMVAKRLIKNELRKIANRLQGT